MLLLLTLESHSTKVSQKKKKSHSTKGQNYMTLYKSDFLFGVIVFPGSQ